MNGTQKSIVFATGGVLLGLAIGTYIALDKLKIKNAQPDQYEAVQKAPIDWSKSTINIATKKADGDWHHYANMPLDQNNTINGLAAGDPLLDVGLEPSITGGKSPTLDLTPRFIAKCATKEGIISITLKLAAPATQWESSFTCNQQEWQFSVANSAARSKEHSTSEQASKAAHNNP